MKDIRELIGKEYFSLHTNDTYGVFRAVDEDFPEGFSIENFGVPFATDGCGNLFTQNIAKEICFWDHETNEIILVAKTWEELVDGCRKPEEIEIREEDILAVWVCPKFAKTNGIDAPKDGWIKKEEEN